MDNYRTVHEVKSLSEQEEETSRKSNLEKSPAKKRRHTSPETGTIKKTRKSKTKKDEKSSKTSDKSSKNIDKSSKSVEKSPKKSGLEIDVNREIVPQLASIVKTSTAMPSVEDKKSKKNSRLILFSFLSFFHIKLFKMFTPI